MDLNLIKRLIKLVDTSDITDLEVEENGLRVKIGKNTVVNQQVTMPAPLSVQPVVQTAQPQFESVKNEKEVSSTSEKFHEIKSPIVGTFYRAPAPDADSYVQVGDSVSPGTVLCIVEAMKLMNEIESDTSGKIVKILVENGKPVEYNQPLFLLKVE